LQSYQVAVAGFEINSVAQYRRSAISPMQRYARSFVVPYFAARDRVERKNSITLGGVHYSVVHQWHSFGSVGVTFHVPHPNWNQPGDSVAVDLVKRTEAMSRVIAQIRQPILAGSFGEVLGYHLRSSARATKTS
jgi:hypothetical protein